MITKDLGKRIQELRKEKTGLSQEKFALKIEHELHPQLRRRVCPERFRVRINDRLFLKGHN